MDAFSRVDSAIPISPESGGVWKTRKRSRAGEQKGRDKGQYRKKEDEKREREGAAQDAEKTSGDELEIQNPRGEVPAVYGTNGHRKKISGKIDVII